MSKLCRFSHFCNCVNKWLTFRLFLPAPLIDIPLQKIRLLALFGVF
ncbi:hypothetical protein BN134_2004 [Cronobacter dublinensis 1210]|uniref:Uncharacterized protein n=1 Tax=Cronobacter dublinensis 1210 TaxID=1208656 RepID=A0ABM9Q755_9ENTR|nr:hypothetical protein BN134_2004 [Cronobacter dublinensis 1210]